MPLNSAQALSAGCIFTIELPRRKKDFKDGGAGTLSVYYKAQNALEIGYTQKLIVYHKGPHQRSAERDGSSRNSVFSFFFFLCLGLFRA
jgi:hypothetical protein